MHKIALFSILLFTLNACTKIIEVDLNSADKRVIIEGIISDQAGPYTVKITKTVNFSDPNVYPAVSGAEVIISDNTGGVQTLTETSPGVYTTANLQGVPGTTYTLKVVAEGKTYTATSTMPQPIDFQGVEITESTFGPPSGDEKSYDILPVFVDAADEANNYRAIQAANGFVDNSFFNVTNDVLINGQVFPFPLFNEGLKLKSGDEVLVTIECIDKGVYDYFFSLGQVVSGQSGTPANPVSNITGGALGYFSAQAVRTAVGVVP